MIPPQTILVAVDFSDTSRTALVLAARLARHCGAKLHVLHAQDPILSMSAHHAGIDLALETNEELQRFVTSAWPAVECSPECHVAAGIAIPVILDAARRVQAQRVVVGSHGMSGAARLMFGSTTEGLLRRADVSVLVAPAEWTSPRPDAVDLSGMGPVVVGVDLSEPSIAAAKAACALASLLQTWVSVVHVVPKLAVLSRWRAHADSAIHDRVAAVRQELKLMVGGLGCPVSVEVSVEVGAVPHLLAEAAAPVGDRAPILVLGKNASGSTGAAPGATAYGVLSHAKVPVLMHVAGSGERT